MLSHIFCPDGDSLEGVSPTVGGAAGIPAPPVYALISDASC